MAVLQIGSMALMVVAMLLSALSAVVAALFERGGHIRIRHWAKQAGGSVSSLYASRTHFEAFRYLLTLLSRFLLLLVLLSLWNLQSNSDSGRPTSISLPLIVVLTMMGYLFATEWLTRYLSRRHAERSLALLTPIYRSLYFLFRPLIWALAPVVRFAEKAQYEDDEDEASEHEIDAYIDVGRREGILEPKEGEMVRSVVDFGDTQVRSVMTPRVEINSASADASLEELAKRFFETKNSRLPLFRGSIDDIVGILHIRDLFQAMYSGQSELPVDEICQQPFYVPESKPLRTSLEELQARRQQMAIVVDEYGGVAGLVTVEDLVEEIVGEIRDEHEDHEGHETLADGRWRLSGRSYLEDFKEIVGLELDVDDLPYETLSGLICGQLGYVPNVGERLSYLGLEFLVEEADDRRVTQVAVARGPITKSFAAVVES